MSNTRFFVAVIARLVSASVCSAQTGQIFTVAGGGTNYPDRVSAVSAALSRPGGICVDAAGNVYVAENGRSTIRKIGADGLITAVAGNGTYGYIYDNGLAIRAGITDVNCLYADGAGNLFLSDNADDRIREVIAATGIITTVAGGGTSYADGIPATTANIYTQTGICADQAGNIYCSGYNSVRKIDAATGNITTVAGLSGGSVSLSMDGMGNLYILTTSGTLLKIDHSTGMSTSIPGSFGTSCCVSDGMGNIFFVDGLTIKRRDVTTGAIDIIAGGGTSGAEGTPALSALIHPNKLYLDAAGGNIYFTDDYTNELKKFSLASLSFGSDSFYVSCNKACSGPELSVITPHYIYGRSVKTYFGDGTSDSTVIQPGPIGNGYASINHAYQTSGTYTIKEILYSGSVLVDTFTYTYVYSFCRTLPVKFFYDNNSNCLKDATEPYSSEPSLTEVDRNGVQVGMLSATSGVNYNAYGAPGDVFTFKSISSANGPQTTCPASGTISETILSAVTAYPDQYFGFTCTGSNFDLSVNTVVIFNGVHEQYGYLYASNLACDATPANVTLNFSPKWYFSTSEAVPAASSVTGTSATWNAGTVTAYDATPVRMFYMLRYNPAIGPLNIGDTVNNLCMVSPTVGDLNPGNNTDAKVEKVKDGFDPNEMFAYPEDCVPADSTHMQYVISFENTGNDTAHNIYVMDTLPDFVDPSSLRLVMASATMNTTLLNYGNYNIARFDFPLINLLDSSHHGVCDGAVIFNINLKNGLADGTNILNHAGIFFDDNPVVMTNTVSNTIGCEILKVPAVSAQQEAGIYPNPATDEVTIKTDYSAYSAMTVANSIGQIMMQQQLPQPQTKVNVKSLPAGLYYITLRGDNGSKVMKLVKM
jgi:uncharacterized repeat protein (TIGR01451 family)